MNIMDGKVNEKTSDSKRKRINNEAMPLRVVLSVKDNLLLLNNSTDFSLSIFASKISEITNEL